VLTALARPSYLRCLSVLSYLLYYGGAYGLHHLLSESMLASEAKDGPSLIDVTYLDSVIPLQHTVLQRVTNTPDCAMPCQPLDRDVCLRDRPPEPVSASTKPLR
jgi:hypothetical protein